MRHASSAPSRAGAALALAVALLVIAAAVPRSATQKFYPDDPLGREPSSQDASGVTPWDIDLFYDLAYNLFVTGRRAPQGIRAENVNTIDEVPDSEWFTNRIGARTLTAEEVTRGGVVGPAPAHESWTITREKSSGAAPGFTAKDANGETWFLSFDAPSNPEGATGALVIATRIFWALGYNQVEYFLTEFRRDHLTIAPDATSRRPNGQRTPITDDDVSAVLERADRLPDGAFRAAAGRLIAGKVLGGFKYVGTRPDDPNDIVPHEHRRELRALRVFGAWTNLTDMKAGNTLDTLITENGRGVVRHYLQDVGSTFGVGANGPHESSEGWEYLYEGDPLVRRLVSFGFWLSPWQTIRYKDFPAVGTFEGTVFDPTTWKPRAPTGAYMEMRADDAFWAAQRVMAFSDALIREIVRTGGFHDPGAEQHMGDILIERRDAIGRAYLPAINPIVTPALSPSGALTFGNAAVTYGFATAPRRYLAAWSRFDNVSGVSTPIGETSGDGTTLQAPADLPVAPGSFVHIALRAEHPDHASWNEPVQVYFRRDGAAWTLVGFERLPEETVAVKGAK